MALIRRLAPRRASNWCRGELNDYSNGLVPTGTASRGGHTCSAAVFGRRIVSFVRVAAVMTAIGAGGLTLGASSRWWLRVPQFKVMNGRSMGFKGQHETGAGLGCPGRPRMVPWSCRAAELRCRPACRLVVNCRVGGGCDRRLANARSRVGRRPLAFGGRARVCGGAGAMRRPSRVGR